MFLVHLERSERRILYSWRYFCFMILRIQTEINMKFLLSINYIFWLILSALFFAVGEFLSKKFALGPKFIYVALMLITYSLGVLAWLPAILQRNSLSIVGTMWSVLSLLTTILIGVLIFGEKIGTLGIIGMVTAVVSIILLSVG